MQHNQALQTSDELFNQVFGDGIGEGYLPSLLAHKESVLNPNPAAMPTPHHTPHKPPPKTYATFSQLMTLAHNFNRKHGHPFVNGCHCESCHMHRQAA